MDELSHFKETFFTECGELLADMEAGLSALQPGMQDADKLNAIFRAAHSIKGGAGAFGFDSVMRFTHVLEALLDGLRDNRLALTAPIIALMLKATDATALMLEEARAGKASDPAATADILQQLEVAVGQSATAPAVAIESMVSTATNAASYQIGFAPHPHFFQNGSDPLAVLQELSRLGQATITTDLSAVPTLEELDPTICALRFSIMLQGGVSRAAIDECFEFVSDMADISVTAEAVETAQTTADAGKTPQSVTPGGQSGGGSIRVDLDKIDRLVNTVGELVIAEAMVSARLRDLPAPYAASLQRDLDELAQYTRELQEAVMAVRMQPVKSVFARMPRIVRDTAAQLGKDIQLVMQGENTEIDKTVIEQLADPLIHMIRNSIDHGIESPDQRAWDDKPAQGTITLSASQRSGRIWIEIADDGAGINRPRVLAKAQEKGIVPPDAILSDTDIDNLIFLPGFSTATAVTSVSGRGVGMDVVKRNIESLGGSVVVSSTPGQGSLFSISLPLTLAILDGMIVRIGTEHYIIPTVSILETMRPAPDSVHGVNGHSDVLNVRGEIVSIVRLASIFGIANAEADISRALVVLVESGGEKMGLVVDELVGQQQVVIKSLEPNTQAVRGISSATILGDGKVSLILEINDLKNLCHARRQELATAA